MKNTAATQEQLREMQVALDKMAPKTDNELATYAVKTWQLEKLAAEARGHVPMTLAESVEIHFGRHCNLYRTLCGRA